MTEFYHPPSNSELQYITGSAAHTLDWVEYNNNNTNNAIDNDSELDAAIEESLDATVIRMDSNNNNNPSSIYSADLDAEYAEYRHQQSEFESDQLDAGHRASYYNQLQYEDYDNEADNNNQQQQQQQLEYNQQQQPQIIDRSQWTEITNSVRLTVNPNRIPAQFRNPQKSAAILKQAIAAQLEPQSQSQQQPQHPISIPILNSSRHILTAINSIKSSEFNPESHSKLIESELIKSHYGKKLTKKSLNFKLNERRYPELDNNNNNNNSNNIENNNNSNNSNTAAIPHQKRLVSKQLNREWELKQLNHNPTIINNIQSKSYNSINIVKPALSIQLPNNYHNSNLAFKPIIRLQYSRDVKSILKQLDLRR